MKKIKRAFKRLRAKTRGIISRGGDGGGAPRKDGDRDGNDGVLWQLASFVAATTAAAAVSAGLTLCDFGAIHNLTPFGPSCARGSQISGNMSVGAGVGFVVFLFMEVTAMVFAQIYRDRQRRESAELRAEVAEQKLRAEVAELKVEVSEQTRRAEVAEQTRKAEVAEQTRRAEVAELSRRIEVAEQSRRAEAERAARLELELKLATRNAENNGDGENG